MMTDEAQYYGEVGREMAQHEMVNHKKEEYVRGDVHTNTAEGFFSIFKARHARRLPALQREALAPLSGRI